VGSGASLRPRFCLFFSPCVNLSAADTEGAGVADGDGEDVAVGVDVGEVIGTVRRGWNFRACDSTPGSRCRSPNFSSCDAPADGEAVVIARGATVCSLNCSGGVEETVEVGLGDDAGDAIGEAEDVDAGDGVARPRVGEIIGEVVGDDVAREVAVAAGVTVGVIADPGVSGSRAGLRGRAVAVDSGVTDADSAGAVVAVAAAEGDGDAGEAAFVSAAGADSLADFTNFFEGASGGGVDSDFILVRACSAACRSPMSSQPCSTTVCAMAALTVRGRWAGRPIAITGAGIAITWPRTTGRPTSTLRLTLTSRSRRKRSIGC
jgi:hypothetical protein